MLFSEPKIPQSCTRGLIQTRADVSVLFSEPKIPQSVLADAPELHGMSFSALQRAENSSIGLGFREAAGDAQFQCSSASRKFLNRASRQPTATPEQSFSALQRAENSSMRDRNERIPRHGRVSVLFSEPKIPQSPSSCPGSSTGM